MLVVFNVDFGSKTSIFGSYTFCWSQLKRANTHNNNHPHIQFHTNLNPPPPPSPVPSHPAKKTKSPEATVIMLSNPENKVKLHTYTDARDEDKKKKKKTDCLTKLPRMVWCWDTRVAFVSAYKSPKQQFCNKFWQTTITKIFCVSAFEWWFRSSDEISTSICFSFLCLWQ